MTGPSRHPLRLGLTGPIGCGKSTVAGWLAERPGVVAIDADGVAREVLAPGTDEVAAVYARFGDALRAKDGSLDRAALGRIVFADPAELRALEAIVHPAVRIRVLAALDQAERDGALAVVIEAIKLVEGGLAAMCDEVWLVACDPAIQRSRLLGRGTSARDATARIDAQGSLVERWRSAATFVLDSSGAAAAVRQAAEDCLERLLSRTA
ncbi:MAG: dephospho-CoA kinase [Candidatus Limnocylindrales bacterium]